ncbi:MAG: hypothetical protein EOR68_29605 [Mesorhizobium sp.]|nr:MAG: hypothetical protein EOR68_29605 [Mesorhizobium sp.]TIP45712.1 MAG: hypothetical protein E5X77_18160 [Mesorhizobium sp.]TJV68182.1 MAG: hypothetical protein E5X76_30540 [Mesorhizobium sp.]
MAKRSPGVGSLISRLLRAPVVADIASAKTLTNLSTSARIRSFEQLAVTSHVWLITDKDADVTHRRRVILAAGGHQALIARFANFLEKHQGPPGPERAPAWDADLAALLKAYSRATGKYNRSKPHRDPVLQRA